MSAAGIILQVSAAVVVGGALGLVFRRLGAAARSAIWLGVFVVILLAPLLQLLVGPWLASTVPGVLPPVAIATQAALSGMAPAEAAEQGAMPQWLYVCAGVWLVLALLALVRIGHGLMCMYRIAARGRPVTEPAILEQAEAARRLLRIRRRIRLRWSQEVEWPVTFGSLCPIVLLPGHATGWSEPHRRSVLLHEFAHVRRLDAFTLLCASILAAIHWFNPLVRMALFRLRAEQEHACDNEVLRTGVHPADYVLHLVASARAARPRRHAALVTAALDSGDLKSRTSALLSADRRGLTGFRWGPGIAFACYLLAASPVAVLTPASAEAAGASHAAELRPLEISVSASQPPAPLRPLRAATAAASGPAQAPVTLRPAVPRATPIGSPVGPDGEAESAAGEDHLAAPQATPRLVPAGAPRPPDLQPFLKPDSTSSRGISPVREPMPLTGH